MNYEMYLSQPRWTILAILAKKSSSPVEISVEIKTSVSYVSQQLKLLEAAGLVTKEKTGSVEKGKPRLVYSIAREILQLTGLMKGLPVKKHLLLTGHHRAILGIWGLENEDLHYYVEKLYWILDDYLTDIKAIFVTPASEILVVSDSKKVKTEVESFSKKFEKKISVKTLLEKDLHDVEHLHAIHDPHWLGKKMKGGYTK